MTACPCTPSSAAAASARSISGSTSSRLSSGRPGEHEPAAGERPVRLGDPRRLGGRLDARRDRRAAARGVEERQLVRSPAEHGDAERLEELGRRRHVEQRLDPRGDDQRLRARDRVQVGRDVRGVGPAAMDAAEPAGRHEADPGRPADGERPSDGRCADDSLDGGRREIAWAELARRGVEPLELRGRQADDDLAVEHADGRRDASSVADRPLRGESDLDALARREAVGDQRRLERDDAALRLRALREPLRRL